MLRIAREEDLPQMLAIYGPYVENTTWSFEYQVPTPEGFLQRFREITTQFPWLVWEEKGEILGYAYGSAPFGAREAYAWCAESSIYLRQDVRGRGLGRKLYAALEALLSLQGYQVVYALVTSENTPSLAFHRRLGYVLRAEFPRCGYKFGRWVGVQWYEKQLDLVESPSNFPERAMSIVIPTQKITDILYNLSIS